MVFQNACMIWLGKHAYDGSFFAEYPRWSVAFKNHCGHWYQVVNCISTIYRLALSKDHSFGFTHKHVDKIEISDFVFKITKTNSLTTLTCNY